MRYLFSSTLKKNMASYFNKLTKLFDFPLLCFSAFYSFYFISVIFFYFSIISKSRDHVTRMYYEDTHAWLVAWLSSSSIYVPVYHSMECNKNTQLFSFILVIVSVIWYQSNLLNFRLVYSLDSSLWFLFPAFPSFSHGSLRLFPYKPA